MSAAPAAETPAEKPTAASQIIYPKNSPERPADLPASGSSSSSLLVGLTAVVLAAAGAWILIQRRNLGPLAGRHGRQLQIEETRPLGGRQYLVVASYDGKKYLLGVTPGQINLLTPLDEDTKSPDAPKPAAPKFPEVQP